MQSVWQQSSFGSNHAVYQTEWKQGGDGNCVVHGSDFYGILDSQLFCVPSGNAFISSTPVLNSKKAESCRSGLPTVLLNQRNDMPPSKCRLEVCVQMCV